MKSNAGRYSQSLILSIIFLKRQKQTNAEIEQLCKNGLPNSMRSFTYAKYFKIDPEQETFQTLEDDIFQK